MIIWAFAAYTGFQALSDADLGTVAFAVFIGIIFSVILFFMITIIDRIL